MNRSELKKSIAIESVFIKIEIYSEGNINFLQNNLSALNTLILVNFKRVETFPRLFVRSGGKKSRLTSWNVIHVVSAYLWDEFSL